jgi:hypothetical protein
MPKYSTQKMDLYQLRSAATTGFSISQDTFAKDFPTNLICKLIAEIKQLRPLYNGDFYPLTPINVDAGAWCAWQFHRPDLGQGFAVFFRRPQATQTAFVAALHGLDPKATYEVTFADNGQTQKLSGEELARLQVEIPAAPGSCLFTYRRLDK